jgi:hypothetical protein
MKTSFPQHHMLKHFISANHQLVLISGVLLGLSGCIVVPQPAYVTQPSTNNQYSNVPPSSNYVATPNNNGVNFQVFYDELSPYGNWVDHPRYGYVWVPFADPGFVPYSSRGHWLNTDAGWTWVSDYAWGWAAFHYGRWDMDRQLGWFWVPDYQWGPSWVSWRRSNGYYGWAPIGPGIGMSEAYSSGYNIPSDYWVFVNERDFGRTDVYSYYVPRSNNVTIINNSTIISNTYVDKTRNTTYYTGPQVTEVQNVTGRRYDPVIIRESDHPNQNAGNGELRIYRPNIQQTTTTGRKPTPTRVYTVTEATSSDRRRENSNTQINTNTNPNTNTDPNINNNRREDNKVNSNYQQQNNQDQNKQQQNYNIENENKRRNPVQENSNLNSQPNSNVNQQQNNQQNTQQNQQYNKSSNSNVRREGTSSQPINNVAPKKDTKVVKNDATKKTNTNTAPKTDEKKQNRRDKDN